MVSSFQFWLLPCLNGFKMKILHMLFIGCLAQEWWAWVGGLGVGSVRSARLVSLASVEPLQPGLQEDAWR